MDEIYRAVLERRRPAASMRDRAGRSPSVLLTEGSDEQVDVGQPGRREDIERADVRIVVEAPTQHQGDDEHRPGAPGAACKRARPELRDRYLERALSGELRWVLTRLPDEGRRAGRGDVARPSTRTSSTRAAFLDDGDPVARWREFAERLQRVADFLAGKQELRIVAEDTDLTLAVGGRTWIRSRRPRELPGRRGLHRARWRRASRARSASRSPPSSGAAQVDDVRLRFEEGEVVEATAARGQDFLEEMIAVDEGARRVGEFAFGLNDAIDLFTRNILFDEKIGGTVHLALGTAYPECGGTNRSALHWDMICDLRSGGEVYADGELVYRDGALPQRST